MTNTYDHANRLLTRADGFGTATFTYDHAGNRTTRQDASGITTYSYDDNQRLTAASLPGGRGVITGERTFTFSQIGQFNTFITDEQPLSDLLQPFKANQMYQTSFFSGPGRASYFRVGRLEYALG